MAIFVELYQELGWFEWFSTCTSILYKPDCSPSEESVNQVNQS